RIDPVSFGQSSQALLTTLYRSTDRLCRGGAAVKNLAQSASLHAGENNAPSKPGTKHLRLTIGRVPLFRELGHPVETLGQVAQLLPNFREPGLPRQPSEGIRHVAIMLASRRVVVAGHAAAYSEGFSPPTSVDTDLFRGRAQAQQCSVPASVIVA